MCRKEFDKIIREGTQRHKNPYPEAYDDPDNDWIEVFYKQHKTILHKLQDSRIRSLLGRENKIKNMAPLRALEADHFIKNPELTRLYGYQDLVKHARKAGLLGLLAAISLPLFFGDKKA